MHNFFNNAGSWCTIRRISKEILIRIRHWNLYEENTAEISILIKIARSISLFSRSQSLFSRFRKLQELDRDVHISSPHGFLFHSVLHTMYCDGFPELDLVLDGSILHRGTTLPRCHDHTNDCVPARVQ